LPSSGLVEISASIARQAPFATHQNDVSVIAETPVRVYRDRLSVFGPGLRPALQPTALVA
jgi:hypothetical protein